MKYHINYCEDCIHNIELKCISKKKKDGAGCFPRALMGNHSEEIELTNQEAYWLRQMRVWNCMDASVPIEFILKTLQKLLRNR